MGGRKKWSSAARSPFATIRGHLGPRRKGVEGLCVSSLLGVLRSHTWLIGEEDVAVLLAHSSLPRYQHHRAHSLSFSLCSSSADGGSEDLADPRSPSLDPHLSHVGQGKQTKIPLDSYFFFCFCLSLKLTTLKYCLLTMCLLLVCMFFMSYLCWAPTPLPSRGFTFWLAAIIYKNYLFLTELIARINVI